MNVFLYGCSHRDSIASGEASTVVDGPDDAGYKVGGFQKNGFSTQTYL